MRAYLDTSAIVRALTNEVRTGDIHAWLAARNPEEELIISPWVVTEVSSALAIKLRTQQVTLSGRARALAMFSQMTIDSLVVAPIADSHFHSAAAIVDQHALGLRAGDALHLAIAAILGATVVTLDHRVAHAGPALGIPTILI